ncbi:MAG: ROK family glucokinase [Lachnospiraceae bacterium]|nr:ROK family glucokinase [Lachnospiraceae bacterium]
MAFVVGIDIGGTTVKMGIFEPEGKNLQKWEIPTDTADEGIRILPDIAASIDEKLKEMDLVKSDCLGVGVGVPAPVTKEGIVNGTANLGWKYKEVKKELEALCGLSAVIGNDANVAALGEMWQGGGKGKQDMVMITLGTGVGSGFIVGGKLIVGAHGAGGEGGHIRVNYQEEDICGCGNKGCLEQYASATGIVRLAKKKMAGETRETLLAKEEITAKSVFDAVKEGDQVAREVAEEFGEYLARGLSAMAAMSDPSIFVIGGGVSKAGEILLSYVEKYYKELAFFANRDVEFALASLGNDAGIIGAARLALDAVQ